VRSPHVSPTERKKTTKSEEKKGRKSMEEMKKENIIKTSQITNFKIKINQEAYA
jgi:hypothetical protein